MYAGSNGSGAKRKQPTGSCGDHSENSSEVEPSHTLPAFGSTSATCSGIVADISRNPASGTSASIASFGRSQAQ